MYFQLSLEMREVFRVGSSKLGQVVSYGTFLLKKKGHYFDGCFNFSSNALEEHQRPKEETSKINFPCKGKSE